MLQISKRSNRKYMEDETMERTNVYGSASIPKLLAKTCIPAVITTLVITLYHIADVFFIGQTGDAMQVAAITLSGPVFSVLSGLATLIGSGGCAAIAIALGKKDKARVKSISSFCCFAALGIGAAFAIGINLGMPAILQLLNVSSETSAYAGGYLRITSIGYPLIMFSSVFANVVRGEGAIKESMLGNGIGSIVNIALDPIFILGFGMGITGAAVVTVIANTLSSAYLIYFALSKKSMLSLSIKQFTLKGGIARQALLLGLPTALGVAIMSVSGVVSNHVIGSYGEFAVAASGVSGKLGMLIAMVQIGICMGIQPALAYNYGAGNLPKLHRIIKYTAFLTVAVGSVLSLTGWMMRGSFLSAFLNNPEVISFGEVFIVAGILTGPISGICYLCTSVLQATERITWATVNALLRQGILSIPLLLILNAWVGLAGIAAAGVAVDAIAAAAGAVICIWQLRKLAPSAGPAQQEVRAASLANAS